MVTDLSIDPSKVVSKIVRFIQNSVRNAGFSRVVAGLSGGIDSAVSITLAVRALAASHVYVGIFPYGNLNPEGINDAKFMIDNIRISKANVREINITNLVDSFISLDSPMDNIRKGNIIARVRMILLYDLSKKFNALVLGTENKTEHLLGYFTRFGDEASDIEPIRSLYKTQVRQLAEYLGILEGIVKKAPTAGLWQGQTDEGELGFSYEEADKILYYYHDLKKNKEEIIKDGFKREVVDGVIKRLEDNNYKHLLPYTFI